MSRYFVIIGLQVLILSTVIAQNTPVFFKDSLVNSNNFGLGICYENTLYSTVSYNRICNIKNKNIAIGIEIGSPLLLLVERNKKIAINSGIYLLKNRFNIRSQVEINTNFYEDANSKGEFMNVSIGLFPGLYKPRYFIATEFTYRNNLYTSFNFKETYSIQGHEVLTNTTGNFLLGLNSGFFIKSCFEVQFKIYYNIHRDFKNYPPYTQNVGLGVVSSFWF